MALTTATASSLSGDANELLNNEEREGRAYVGAMNDRSIKAARLGLIMSLQFTESMFFCRTTMRESTWSKTMSHVKKILHQTMKDSEARIFLGCDPSVWKEFASCFAVALPVLEQESFSVPDPSKPESEIPSAASIASHHKTLMTDLERLNDLLTIARNMLATKLKAQNLAAESLFDQQVLILVDICSRVTARGYDGEAGTRAEAQWLIIIAAFKKLLITCLQFLHNLVMHNEHRKLLLWLDLFGNSKPSEALHIQTASAAGLEEVNRPQQSGENGKGMAEPRTNTQDPLSLLPGGGFAYSSGIYEHEDAERLASQVRKTVNGFMNMAMGQALFPLDDDPSGQGGGKERAQDITHLKHQKLYDWTSLPNAILNPTSQNRDIKDGGTHLTPTPQDAAAKLEMAKASLMSRLGSTAEADMDHLQKSVDAAYIKNADCSAQDSVDVGGDDESDYRGPGDHERGLLTDIPLVLGPKEIEALPMIIQAGIVSVKEQDAAGSSEATSDTLQSMQAVRCNILLAQESGRNLLRELLIFIAAWDLQDHEFYFKLMMQIMEAILENGLMPFAYQSFGEDKDIVSPAQSIIIKILTQVFRKQQASPPSIGDNRLLEDKTKVKPPPRVDVLIIHYIFSIFRRVIIPETCALIYLQGQILKSRVSGRDFPLNMWDMERVYEGVYQFLEFFAVLTESEVWKTLLVKWDIVSELVTLLRELDEGIPKAPLGALGQSSAVAGVTTTSEGADGQTSPAPLPVAVERPYDPIVGDTSLLAAEEMPENPDPPSPEGDNQDPSRFEWRNLKKLVVLVLSSLVWKSVAVQEKVRCHGGVEMVLNCCNYDAYNPYIREHAIMCLRFLLEGSPENQRIVEQLEARKAVPDEVLDKQGYETYIDTSGKVGLRRRGGAVAATEVGSGS